jgi:hypothetical protein
MYTVYDDAVPSSHVDYYKSSLKLSYRYPCSSEYVNYTLTLISRYVELRGTSRVFTYILYRAFVFLLWIFITLFSLPLC